MAGFRDISKQLFQPRQAAGIELLLGAQQAGWRLVLLNNHKGNITTLSKAEGIPSVEELSKKIPPGTPVTLSLNGRGILHKFIPESKLSPTTALQKALPNADPQQFYIQLQPTANGSYVSIARKHLVNELLTKCQEQQLSICRLAFGPFELQYLLPVLSEKQQLPAQGQLLNFDTQGQMLEMQSTEDPQGIKVQLGEEAWNSSELPAYAGALHGLMDKPSTVALELLQTTKQELFHRQLFHKGGLAVLAGFMLLLLLNTFGYYWYKGKNEQMQLNLLHSHSQLEQLDTLKNQIDRQQRLLSASGILQQSRSSFYADRIAASLPKDLQLVQLDIFPKTKANNQLESEEELERFHNNLIRLKGKCKSSLSYNEWIKSLQSMDWISEVQHLNYKDLSPRLGAFEIELTLAP